MKNYRYSLRGAVLIGVDKHPQMQMKILGYEVVKSEPCPIADCWFFRTTNEIENQPDYITKLDDDFKFAYEQN